MLTPGKAKGDWGIGPDEIKRKDIGSKHNTEFMIQSWFKEKMAIPAVWIQPMASVGREIRTFIQCWWDRNDTAALGTVCSSSEVKCRVTIWPGSSTPRCAYPRERKTYFHTKTCTRMFIAALFIVDKRWKQLRYLWNYEWVYKIWCIHTMEYYSAIKRNEVMSHANWKKPDTYAKKKKRKRLMSKCGQILIISKHKWGMYWCFSYHILQLFCWNCSNYYRLTNNIFKRQGWGEF